MTTTLQKKKFARETLVSEKEKKRRTLVWVEVRVVQTRHTQTQTDTQTNTERSWTTQNYRPSELLECRSYRRTLVNRARSSE